MSIDPAVSAALKRAVEEARQPATVADRLGGWLQKLADGNDSEDAKKSSYDAVFGQLKADAGSED